MNLAFLLHIYQPPTQDGRVIKQVADSCYVPLIKALRNHPEVKFTLNIPLSLISQLHEQGYHDLIASIRSLYEEDRIELVNTGAYHPLLTKIPEEVMEMELILNEYGLGYYFGKNKGFEGEDALLLKNISGVFPPELAVSEDVVSRLDALGYSWVLVDEVALLPEEKASVSVYNLQNKNIKVITRNTYLSNLISFKRNTGVNNVVSEIISLRQEQDSAVIALDGEFFGHHNENGIYILNSLIEKLSANGISMVSVSDLIETSGEADITAIVESTWGATPADIDNGDLYPMWDKAENELQQLLWELLNTIVSAHPEGYMKFPKMISEPGCPFETLPIWDIDALDKIEDVAVKNHLFRTILFLQSLNSDQFWWASSAIVGGTVMFDAGFIRKSVDLYKKFALISENPELLEKTQSIIVKLEALL